MFYKSEEVQQHMNKAGRAKEPFLFGVDFEMRKGFFIEHPLSRKDVLFQVPSTSSLHTNTSHSSRSYRFDIQPEDYSRYRQRFSRVMEGLKRGESYLANLTIRTPVRTDLSLEDIFYHSNAPYKVCIPERWVCFSPECFVQIKEGKIRTFPMKGTIDALIPGAREVILNDPKETAEHHTTVDLLRNDISRVASGVHVKRLRYIDEVATHKGPLLQVSSEIEGTLPDGYLDNLGNLIFSLLPAGSVTGAPKEATLAMIKEAEMEPRGFYTGIAGYFDGESFDSFVLIRFIEQQEGNFFFRSGGGITANSDCKKEYEEAIHKVYLPFPGHIK